MCLQDIFCGAWLILYAVIMIKFSQDVFFLVLFHKLFARAEIFARIKTNS